VQLGDHCAERILLRRLRGGWLFIHRLLLEYFAELDDMRGRLHFLHRE
jgi:hypothetical protein